MWGRRMLTADLLAVHGQRIVSAGNGDCFRASMSYVLGVPNGDHLPHTTESDWLLVWMRFLGWMGLELAHDFADGPIWRNQWIASVPSKNIEGATHAIVMDNHRVAFDPSPNRRYRRRRSLIGTGIVLGGTWLEVRDARKLDAFVEWRRAHADD